MSVLHLFIPPHSVATHLIRAEWGSGSSEGEGHGGCYDNFIMVFEKCVHFGLFVIATNVHVHIALRFLLIFCLI